MDEPRPLLDAIPDKPWSLSRIHSVAGIKIQLGERRPLPSVHQYPLKSEAIQESSL